MKANCLRCDKQIEIVKNTIPVCSECAKCLHVPGVECKAEKQDCDTCPMWKGPGIVPVIYPDGKEKP